jgi:hypothetical protein
VLKYHKSHAIIQFVNILLSYYPHALCLCSPESHIKEFIFCRNQL